MRSLFLKLRRPPRTFRLTEMMLPLRRLFRVRGCSKFLLLMFTAVNRGVGGTLRKLNSAGGRTTLLPPPRLVVESPFRCKAVRFLATTSTATFTSTCTNGISSTTGRASATRSKVANTLYSVDTHVNTYTYVCYNPLK